MPCRSRRRSTPWLVAELAVPVEAALGWIPGAALNIAAWRGARRHVDTALGRLRGAVLDNPVKTLCSQQRLGGRLTGCPARRSESQSARRGGRGGAWLGPRRGAQHPGQALRLRCRLKRRSAGCPWSARDPGQSTSFSVLVETALGLLPGVPLDIQRSSSGRRCRARQDKARRSGWSLSLPCQSRRRSDGSPARRST